MPPQLIRIYELPRLVTPTTELVGARFEVEIPLGPVQGGFVSRQMTSEEFAEYLGISTTSTPELTAAQLLGKLVAGPGIKLSLGPNDTVVISSTISVPGAVIEPAAPTDGHVDDTGDTFYGTINSGFPALGDYEIYYPGSGGNVPATNGRADLVSGILTIRGLSGPIDPGAVGMRVAASGNRPASDWLTNDKAFTGAVVTPPASAALTAALAISVASIMAGSSITFEVTAGGGTAPYSYAVKATNNATGTVTILGNSATGSFTPQAAGTYNIDATVTDAASKVAQATTRTLTVTAAQSVNQLPVANAGDDLTITAPTSSVALMGTASDPDPGDTLTYLWRPIAGPNTPVGLPATTLNVVVSNLVVGTYQFGFQATDQKGGKSPEDFIVVNVLAGTTTPSGYFPAILGDSRSVYRGEGATAGSPDLALTTSVWAFAQARLNSGSTYSGTILHHGYPGFSAAQMLSTTPNGNEYATQRPSNQTTVQYLMAQVPADKVPVILVAIGANGGTSAEIKAVHDAIKAIRPDAITIADPVLNRLDSNFPTGLPNRTSINSNIDSGVTVWSNDEVRSFNTPQLYAEDAPNNSTYFWQNDFVGLAKVHLTTAGNQLQGENYAQAFARRMGLTLAPLAQGANAPVLVSTGITQTDARIRYAGGGWTNYSYNPRYITTFGGVSLATGRSFGFTGQCYGFRLVGPPSRVFASIKAVENNATIATGSQYSYDTPESAGAPTVQLTKYFGTTLATHAIDIYPTDTTTTDKYLQCNLIQFCDANGVFPPIPDTPDVHTPVWPSGVNAAYANGRVNKAGGVPGQWDGQAYSGFVLQAPPTGTNDVFATIKLLPGNVGTQVGSVLLGLQPSKTTVDIGTLKTALYADSAGSLARWNGSGNFDVVSRTANTVLPGVDVVFSEMNGICTATFYQNGVSYSTYVLDLASPLALVFYGNMSEGDVSGATTYHASALNGITITGAFTLA